jgi:dihydroneopterin triphosphate diphosphatase
MEITSQMVEVHVFKLVNGEMRFLLLKRSEKDIYPRMWQMVTGRIEADEKAYEAALREVFEESGLKAKKMWVVPNIDSFYSADSDGIVLIPVFAVLTDENEPVILSDEHTDFKWVSKEVCIKMLAWQGQQKSVDILCDYYLNRKNYLDLVEIKI